MKEPTPNVVKARNSGVVFRCVKWLSKWNWLGRIFVGLFSVSIFVYGTVTFFSNPVFRIREVDIQLQSEASQSHIFPKIKDVLQARLKNLRGQYVWRVDLEDVLAAVRKDLRVKDAKVSRVLPNQIQITVAPYTPIANVMAKKYDRVYPVARDGEVLPPVDLAEAPDGPILRGEEFLKKDDLRRRAIELLLLLPESGALSLKYISEVHFENKKGFILTLTPSGSQVWMGEENYSIRALHSQRVVDYLKNEGLTGRIIDARVGKKVVVKLRNEP